MNLNYQIQCDDNPINGMYGIIFEYSNGKIKNNNIITGIAGLNIISNSTADIENLTCISLDNIINTAFNSLTSIKTDNNSLIYDKNTTNLFKNSKNSFVNFSNPKFLSYSNSTGGSLTAINDLEYKINENCKWSAIFGNDGGILSGYFWTSINEFLKDSIIENNFQYSSNSIQWADDALFPYLNKLNKNLPIGNGYNITFNFKEINNLSSITVLDFNESLSFNLTNFKDSNINFLNLNSFFINFNGINTPIIINLENLKQIKFNKFNFGNCILNIKNSEVIFENCNFSKNTQINVELSKISFLSLNNLNSILELFNNSFTCKNSVLYIDNNLIDSVSTGFLLLENHLIKAGWEKLTENFGDIFTGALINHTHKFLSFQLGNSQIIIKELISGNTPTIDPINSNAILEHIYKDSINRTEEFLFY